MKAGPRCDECERAGVKYRVYGSGYGITTAMGSEDFWDEEGRHHRHDPNITSSSYSCSHGHSWVVGRRSTCPAGGCDYNAETR